MAECIFESPVEHVNANVDETLNSVTVPSHPASLTHPTTLHALGRILKHQTCIGIWRVSIASAST
jgi:hypothetical protein